MVSYLQCSSVKMICVIHKREISAFKSIYLPERSPYGHAQLLV